MVPQETKKIKLSLSEEDLVAFARYHHDNSPTVKRTVRKAQKMLIVCFTIVLGLLYHLGIGQFVLIGGGVGSVIIILLFPGRVRAHTEKQINSMIQEGSNLSTIGTHQYSLDDEGLIVEAPSCKSKIKWQGMEKIVQNNEYTFVYVSSVSALVIPKGSVLDGDYDSFTSELKDRCQ